MTLTATPDDVVDILDGIGGLVPKQNLFTGPVRPADRSSIPSNAVFVMETAGDPPRHYRGSTDVHYPGLQIRVRSDKNDFDCGQVLARLVHETLHRAPPTGYIELETVASRPLPLGRDEAGHWEWSINLRATIDE